MHLRATRQNAGNATYSLRRHKIRTFLNTVGPLLLFGYFAFICLFYLNRPPINGVVETKTIDARWVFYSWILISIFALDWAKTALANVEAAAVMNPKFAPSTAMEFMWHGDSNWANPIWLLKALWSIFAKLFIDCNWGRGQRKRPSPGGLWISLSFIWILVFAVIPLSGLTMEVTVLSIISHAPAPIAGPNPGTLNFKGGIGLPDLIRGSWRSGGLVTPPRMPQSFMPMTAVQTYPKPTSTTRYIDLITQKRLRFS